MKTYYYGAEEDFLVVSGVNLSVVETDSREGA